MPDRQRSDLAVSHLRARLFCRSRPVSCLVLCPCSIPFSMFNCLYVDALVGLGASRAPPLRYSGRRQLCYYSEGSFLCGLRPLSFVFVFLPSFTYSVAHSLTSVTPYAFSFRSDLMYELTCSCVYILPMWVPTARSRQLRWSIFGYDQSTSLHDWPCSFLPFRRLVPSRGTVCS